MPAGKFSGLCVCSLRSPEARKPRRGCILECEPGEARPCVVEGAVKRRRGRKTITRVRVLRDMAEKDKRHKSPIQTIAESETSGDGGKRSLP